MKDRTTSQQQQDLIEHHQDVDPLDEEDDLVDRVFAHLAARLPEIARNPEGLAQAKMAVRGEFGGRRRYIRSAREEESKRLASEILRLFNGTNATEVARVLRVGRATVYRKLKQAGK